MGAIAGLLGLKGGANGSGYAAPTSADIAAGTNTGQTSQSYNTNQNALNSQQALLAALQGQNGLGNQSQVYGQLQGVANGTGPNPAQAMLNQSTGQNVANQAALMAGQRGAASNVGLIARQAAQQGAATQQQVVGQDATLQANQSLNAINSAGNIANTQAANQIGQANANTTAQQAEQANLLNALQGQNNANVSMQSNINSANAGLANTNIQGQQGIIGGLLNSVGPIAGALAEGGMVKMMAEGGDASAFSGPQSKFGQYLHSVIPSASPTAPAPVFSDSNPGADKLKKATESGASKLTSMFKGDGTSLVDDSTGATDLPDIGVASMAAQGGMTHDYRRGGKVIAKNLKEKAIVAGNSYANDKIPAVLSEDEIVLPREVTQSKDPINASARFVAGVLAKRKAGK